MALLFYVANSYGGHVVVDDRHRRCARFRYFDGSSVRATPLDVLECVRVLRDGVRVFRCFLMGSDGAQLMSFYCCQLKQDVHVVKHEAVYLGGRGRMGDARDVGLQCRLILFFLVYGEDFLCVLGSRVYGVRSLVGVFPVLKVPAVESRREVIVGRDLFVEPASAVNYVDHRVHSAVDGLVRAFYRVAVPLVSARSG